MFVGFPSTQSPAVQWWDYSKTNSATNNTNITLANDCAPVQYFATGGSATTIQITLPPNPAQGKVITLKNDKYGSSTQLIQINDGSVAYISAAILGASSEVTYCYIVQNTLAGTGLSFSNWVRIAGGSTYLNQFGTSIGGHSNSSSGYASTIIGGYGNTSSGFGATIIGGVSNTASSTYAFAGGSNSTANSTNSFAFGSAATARSIVGNTVFSANDAPYSGGAKQLAMLTVGAQTTDATATVLRSNTSAASTANQVVLASNSAYYFRGECVAGVTAAGNTKGWYIEGVIKRATLAASTVLVGTPSVTSLYADAGAATWNLAVTADTTNGALAITATGQAATTIRWLCQIRTTEMGF